VQSLPLVVSLVVAALVGGPLVRALRDHGLVRENFRGAALPFPIGALIPVAALVALIPLALVQELGDAEVFQPGAYPAVTYVIGVALLGLLDDLVGSGAFGRASHDAGRRTQGGDAAASGASRAAHGATADRDAAASGGAPPRGWRGHFGAVFSGGFSTGAAKAIGSLGIALFALSGQGYSTEEYLLGAGVLVLATNLFNLLDLRPGRSAKALLLLGVALTVGSLEFDGLWTVGLFLGPVLVLLPLDLRERGMLGDTGSNAIGAVAGVWLIATLDTTGQAVALAAMALITAYGEFRSISRLIDRTPGLRHLDSLGRTTHA
jgi:UDP-N-acetylmuramyl pentapeptide phosphotransferase/UDP-N-acetylglucosamine-1-phosphate transferase